MIARPGRDAERQQALLAALSHAEAWGGVTPQRIDTHISVVFLVGDRAFKIKKSVVLPFVDFGDLELREQACRREVLLNRRTAPGLYLGVRPIVATAAGPRIVAADMAEADVAPALDWAVAMRRFDADGLVRDRAEQGPLDRILVTEMATAAAQLHMLAAPVRQPDADRRFRKVAEDVLALLAQESAALGVDRLERLNAAVRAALTRWGPTLAARGGGGWVRRCHGDLHLGNICLLDGRPTLFDCIEFNDDFAVIDIVYDLAFLVMDLWRLGQASEASLALGRWLELTGDEAGVALLPLFFAVRALVRAMVALASRGADGAVEAGGFIALAEAALTPRPARLIAVGGLSGSGKSTAARIAAGCLAPPGAVILRSDVIRKHLWGAALDERLPPQAYAKAESMRVYAEMQSRAARLLAQGVSVVLDAMFADPSERAAVAALAASLSAPFTGVWLQADLASRMARAATRVGDVSDATPEVAALQAGYDVGALGDWAIIDSSGEKAATAAQIAAALAL